jgi:hypothetical protein
MEIIDFTIEAHEDREFEDFLDSESTGIQFVPETYSKIAGRVNRPDAGPFIKWLRHEHPNVKVHWERGDSSLVLHSHDFWFPIAYLASDTAVTFYLSLVANYVYDRLRGALTKDRNTVNLEVVFQQGATTKRLSYKGSLEGLKASIKKVDVNQLFD